MITLAGYQIAEKIYESSKTIVYRGRRQEDAVPVVIKVLKNEFPTLRELAIFRNQYNLTRDLNLPSVVQAYSLEPCRNGLALVMEDFEAHSLKTQLEEQSLDLDQFFAIALQITQALADLHQHRIVHKDIKPANLLLNPQTGLVKITDFSIASILPKENPVLSSPDALEGTLSYMSPEQTGRMNRGIDYRTDFYSLGITFYQLLTQQLPFQSDDPLELVHCHIARTPVSPSVLNPTIPSVVSSIVLKLMAKMAEDRYQSALGLKHDLEQCQQQWQAGQTIHPFPLGQKDWCDRCQIPEKLYGRESELATLLATFERVAGAGSRELMLISGYSGIGKSALVQEIYKPLCTMRTSEGTRRQQGYFISGKFDQLQRNVPYSAIVHAFQSLIRQLLTENTVQLNQWRDKLLAALGTNGQLIVDVIPEIELIIGKQPAVKKLAPSEAQNRFDVIFQNFVRVFCQQAHPLVIFLDDLQWADSATLRLIKLMLIDQQTQYLFLIGAYRSNEVTSAHPLILMLEELQKRAISLNQITLAPLTLAHVIDLISDTLHHDEQTVQPLAELVLDKTAGNPFFINEFLKTLHQENLLTFNSASQQWQWNIADIKAMDITDNVVELMVRKLRKLPDSTRQLLQIAACIGNRFDLKTLAIAHASTLYELAQILLPATQAGLISATSKPEVIQTEAANYHLVAIHYKFLHDRIQQAAYVLIDATQRQAVHLQIGQLLLKQFDASQRNERIFELLKHLNLGRELISSCVERDELAKLNLVAGKKAKSATAYMAAKEYFQEAEKNLVGNIWLDNYELAITLYKEQAEIEYLTGDLGQSEKRIRQILIHAKSSIEKAKVHRLLIVIYTLQGRYQDAIAAAREGLTLVGIDVPETNLQAALDAEMSQAVQQLANRSIASLLDTPKITQPEKKVAIELLMYAGSPTYISDQALWRVMNMKLVNFSLQHGHRSESAHGYANYGLLLGSLQQDYHTGYEFGQLGLKISEQFHSQVEKCKTCLVIGNCLNHWIKPLREDEAIFLEGYQAGLESGELQYAGYNIGYTLASAFYQGVNLHLLLKKSLGYLQFTQQSQNQFATDVLRAGQLAIENLVSDNPNPLHFDNQTLNQAEFLADCQQHSSLVAVCHYYIYQAQILFLYEQPSAALEYLRSAKELLSSIPGNISLAAYYFYDSLSLLTLYPKASELEKQAYWEQVMTNQATMKCWMEHCPENFLHLYQLVQAEIARVSEDEWTAIALYDEAIASAKDNGFIQNEALANELAAKFWLSKNKTKLAKPYLLDAYYGYQNWGAKAKITILEQHYADLLTGVSGTTFETLAPTHSKLISHAGSSTSTTTRLLDLTAFLKASQAIAQEIELESLLKTLMKVVLENAGAEKGALILLEDGEMVIAVRGVSDRCGVTVPDALPRSLEDVLPIQIVHYVCRTQENLLLDDATTATTFVLDPYIIQHQPKSILACPIHYQGKLTGALYLENNQTTSAFTRDRVEVLTLLATQIATSLENATLYQDLQSANAALRTSETLERERAMQLEHSLHKLQQTQSQLIQTEKISSLGQLVAGVAHEVNNPVGFISGNLHYAQRYITDLLDLVRLFQQHIPNLPPAIADKIEEIDLDYLAEDLPKLITSMKLGTDRIRDIMLSLRNYSRTDEGEKRTVDIHEGIETTLMILSHRLKASNQRPAIQIVKEYGPLPPIECYPGQLNQVFMNILANAIDALEESNQGKSYVELEQTPNIITIRTGLEDNCVRIQVSDNGPGIPEEIRQKLFTPFFTTKPEGKGTGLGLSISYEIITGKHNGTLECLSVPGQGTTFLIELHRN
ncbi:MAG: AAA family ATPase [Oscillatoriales cyanobacterium C42_A2020_001]|nr:AAA family ATPase [Leptolyngbyaceae cyanobacterium C42_A2020_001]